MIVEDAVGPVLRMCDEVESVIRAIQDDNPPDLEIVDRGAYVRVQRRGFLRVTRGSLERHLGAGFHMSRLESIMSAFAGRIRTSSDEIVWYLQSASISSKENPR
jgi:toluene monooxygenase system protein D